MNRVVTVLIGIALVLPKSRLEIQTDESGRENLHPNDGMDDGYLRGGLEEMEWRT